VVPTDVSNPDAVRNLFSKTLNKFGRIDVLFNNAGIFGPSGLVEDILFEEWKAVMDINVTGAFLCAREAFRIMKDQHPMGGAHHQSRPAISSDDDSRQMTDPRFQAMHTTLKGLRVACRLSLNLLVKI
jgi:NAD(P)-dependent dehydrogenase (short-subunit alcohol dehydrogenase family)